MATNNGAQPEPQTFRMFNVQLDSGHKLIYISDGYITKSEAGKRIRAKFQQGGKFIEG